jgi:hypothetical protein
MMLSAANVSRLPGTINRQIDLDQVDRECASIREAYSVLWSAADYGRYGLARILGSTECWTEERCAAAARLFDDSPAGKDEIATELMRLVACFPNATRANLKIYSEQLAEDVISVSPGRIVLRLAMRNLRRTSTFLPSIAEALKEIETARTVINDARHLLTRLPKLREETRAKLQEAEAWDARYGARCPGGRNEKLEIHPALNGA